MAEIEPLRGHLHIAHEMAKRLPDGDYGEQVTTVAGLKKELTAAVREVDGFDMRARTRDSMIPKLVAAARRLIAENEETAENSHVPGHWRERWSIDDPDNYEAVMDLKTWCDALEIQA